MINRYDHSRCLYYFTDMSSFDFWHQKQTVFDINLHLLAMPASQAYVKRIFSASGLLSSGKMNHIDKSQEMRTWMKVNAIPLRDTSIL